MTMAAAPDGSHPMTMVAATDVSNQMAKAMTIAMILVMSLAITAAPRGSHPGVI